MFLWRSHHDPHRPPALSFLQETAGPHSLKAASVIFIYSLFLKHFFVPFFFFFFFSSFLLCMALVKLFPQLNGKVTYLTVADRMWAAEMQTSLVIETALTAGVISRHVCKLHFCSHLCSSSYKHGHHTEILLC